MIIIHGLINDYSYLGIPYSEYRRVDIKSKGLVFIQHGYESNKNKGADYLAINLARIGYTSVAIDAYKHGERIEEPSDLAHFLSARWGLFSQGFGGRLRYAPVDHETWILHNATLEHLEDTLVVTAGLPVPTGAAHVLYSPGVSVRIGVPHSV